MRDVEQLRCRQEAGGVIVPVKAVPGASRDRVAGVLGGALKIATSVAPEKGKANEALAGILAAAVGVAARDVTLVSGPASPRKEFRVAGLTAGELRGRLERL